MTDPNISATRNLSIDLIKIIAMAMVVCRHTSMFFMDLSESHFNLAWSLNSLSIICVPLFFMVSGYLLTGRGAGYGYAMRKILAILRMVVIFVGGVYLCHYAVKRGDFVDMAFLKTFYVFWYFVAMALIYLLYPLLERLVGNRRHYMRAFAALCAVECVVFAINFNSRGEEAVPQFLRVWNWLFYFMAGGMIKLYTGIRSAFSVRTLTAAVVVLGVAVIWLRGILADRMPGNGVEYFYSFPVMMLFTVAVFLWGYNRKTGDSRAIREFSALFLPIFAIHALILIVIPSRLFTALPCAPLLYFATIFTATALLSWFLMKLPLAQLVFRI